MRSWIIGGALLALNLSACGSITSTQQLRQARQSVEAIEGTPTAQRSVYEVTLAEAFLAKADAEWAQSDWQQAKRYAEAARTWAEAAEERARNGAKPTGVED